MMNCGKYCTRQGVLGTVYLGYLVVLVDSDQLAGPATFLPRLYADIVFGYCLPSPITPNSCIRMCCSYLQVFKYASSSINR